MKASELVDEARELFARSADPVIADKYRRYFTEGYDPYGVDAQIVSAKVREVLGRGIDISTAFRACDEFIGSGRYEEGHFAIALIKGLKAQYTRDTFHAVERWFDFGIGNWAHDDGLCLDVVAALLAAGHAGLSDIAPWALSPHKYQRRALPVSLIKVAGSDGFPLGMSLTAVECLFGDEEKVVHQGLGWFLREVWKDNPYEVEELLLRYRETGARLIYQYATEKMSKEEKDKFRRKSSK